MKEHTINRDISAVSTNMEVNKILVVRNDNIGDVVCTTPCFEALKKTFPHARLGVLVNRIAEEVVQGNPWLDMVFVYDKAKHGRYRHPIIAWYHQAKVLQRIRKERFDLAIGIRSAFSTSQAWLVYASGAHLRLGHKPPPSEARWRFFYNLFVPEQPLSIHEVERSLNIIRTVGAVIENKRLYWPLRAEGKETAEQFIRSHFGEDNRPLVIVNYCGRPEENRSWAEEKYAELIELIQKNSDVKVVLTHGPGDEDIIKRILKRLSCQPPIFPPGLKNFAALIARSEVMVSIQGGPTHVAAAVGTPTVAIFDKTSSQVWRPWGDQHRVIKKGNSANLVEVEEVYEAVRELLSLQIGDARLD